MRSIIRTILLGVIAVLALSVLASASASAALPEFKGAEFPERITFSGTEVEITNTIWEGLESPRCASGEGEGNITGAQTATVKLHFNKCASASTGSCMSRGAKSEEIVTSSMPAQLVYLSKEKHEAALVIDYSTKKASEMTPFAEWECNTLGGLNAVRGPIVVPIATNKKQKTYTLSLAATKGKQTPSAYENAEGKQVSAYPEAEVGNGGGWNPGSMTAGKFEMTARAAIEIKA